MEKGNVFPPSGYPLPSPFDIHLASFLQRLRVEGYADRSLRKKRTIVASFARWSVSKQIPANDLNEVHLRAFGERDPSTKGRIEKDLATLRPFIKHFRAERGMPSSPLRIDTSPVNGLTQRYLGYLRQERGLTENTIRVYVPLIRDFLDNLVAKAGSPSPERLTAMMVRDFLIDRGNSRSSEYLRLFATALRSFFRFLYLRGETAIDLSCSVPTVRKYRGAEVHPFFSPEEIERVLSATDRSLPRGRRDYAILLLLSRLGLRAGEVVTLELGDIHWRTGELIVRGKGRVVNRLPLLADIGEALALYLHKDRSVGVSRQVFLRMIAPHVGLAGPAAIGHVVRLALRRAGLRSPMGSVAHLFRHSLATQMIRHGASLVEISEILRHRALSSTMVYAKVDFQSLRGVARDWPGGAR